MTDTKEQTDSTETPGNNTKTQNRIVSKSHRLPPSAYREVGISGRVSPAMQRARMAVERGREFRSEAAAAIAVPADTNGYQSDDELTLAATATATRTEDLQTPLPKRPASALAGQMDPTQVVRQPVQPGGHQSQQQSPVVPAQKKQRSEGREPPSDQQRQSPCVHQASLDELFAKYPSMQASFKLLPPKKQQEQWSRLFQLLDSQQASMTAWQSVQHSDQLEQMRSRVRRELSEERLLLDRRLANHSRLTDEAAGNWGASRRGNPVRTVPYEARSTNKLIESPSESPVKLRASPVVQSYPKLEQQAQQQPSGTSHQSRQEHQLHSNQADFQRLQQYQQQLLQHQPQVTTGTGRQNYSNSADSADEWRSVQLHSQLTEMANQLAETRREADWLRARMGEVNCRVDELLTENFRLKARLGEVNNMQREIQCNSGSPRQSWSPNRSDDSTRRSPPTTMDRRSTRTSTGPAGVETTSSTVAALRQSLAELERRNLIDRSPSRNRSRSNQKKAVEKVKSRGLHESSQNPKNRRHQQRREEASSPPPPPSSARPRSGKLRSNGRYTGLKS